MKKEIYLQKSLDNNVSQITALFNDELLKVKYITNINNKDLRMAIIYFGHLVKRDYIHDSITKPLIEFTFKIEKGLALKTLKESVITASEVVEQTSIDDIATDLMMGRTVLLIDKVNTALVMETNDRISRTTEEPEPEKILRGPREGFSESLLYNISLVRRKILSPNFKFEYFKIGKNTNTHYCICYFVGLVDTQVLDEVKKRLNRVRPDGIIDSHTIHQAISEKGYSPFDTIGYTEKPDTFVSKILEGKVGIIVDGTPVALTVPQLFVENFQSSEDYYVSPYFASLSRFSRILGFFTSLFLPAVYIAVITHHWEVLPLALAQALAKAQMGTPFPSIIECFLLLLTFEVLRETGVRVPSGVGQSLSVVGAIVIGQAAVEASLVSPTMVFIVSLTAITGLINYKMKGAAIVLRYLNIIIAALFGLYGCLFAFFGLLVHLFNIRAFGVQYMERSVPFTLKNIGDSFIRVPMEDINTSGSVEK
ncbi:MAG TPA: spore germination protein [Acholeplasmataceae bacterium]|jgi:spore germination protein KA|nr:spore germination protein [Acholeplasmataceae bacterium]